jgi:anhydro-N-acetylmuramic acid kinase
MMEKMRTYHIIGLMSGSSMDGVDVAYCTFNLQDNKWQYRIEIAETIPYNETWRVRLSQLRKQFSLIYVKTDVYYGHYLGQIVKDFIQKHQIHVDLIASHGHTIFHYPDERITAQIGDGATIASVTHIPVVNNFRRADMAIGGQGAPLVGIGDQLLFDQYDYCINLGGFANISGKDASGKPMSFDMAPCNIPLNRIARDLDQDFDQNGSIAAKGLVNEDLLNELNHIPFYRTFKPKSLNRDWINQEFWPIVKQYDTLSPEDKMKTIAEHVALQIAKSIDFMDENNGTGKKALLTGGGTHNTTLTQLIQRHSNASFVIPEQNLIDYKEALIFALMGVLRLNNMFNCLGTYTGAPSDSIGGSLHGNFSKLI